MPSLAHFCGLSLSMCLLGIGIAIWPWARTHSKIGFGGALFDKHKTPRMFWVTILFNSIAGCGAGCYLLFQILTA